MPGDMINRDLFIEKSYENLINSLNIGNVTNCIYCKHKCVIIYVIVQNIGKYVMLCNLTTQRIIQTNRF